MVLRHGIGEGEVLTGVVWLGSLTTGREALLILVPLATLYEYLEAMHHFFQLGSVLFCSEPWHTGY